VSSAAAYKGWERRRENEGRSSVNIPAELLPLWNRTKARFKGTPHQRYERFMHYAEAHPDEAVQAVERISAKKLKTLIEDASFDFGHNVEQVSKSDCLVAVQAHWRKCRKKKPATPRKRKPRPERPIAAPVRVREATASSFLHRDLASLRKVFR